MKTYLDVLEKVQYLDQERIDRSIWVSPLWVGADPKMFKEFFQYSKECGLVTNVRIKQGKTVAKANGNPNVYGIIEFSHVNSVARALRVASKKESNINGHRVRIYKAGSDVT